MSELGSHNTALAVGADDLAPNSSVLAISLQRRSFVYENNFLSQVETGTLGVSNAVDGDQ